MIMNKLVVKNGAIYDRNGVKQALEFGNVDQIAAIKEYGRTMYDLQNEGLGLEVDYEVTVEASVNFKCGCGLNVCFFSDASDEGDIDCFDGDTKTCNCGVKYELKVDENDVLKAIIVKQ